MFVLFPVSFEFNCFRVIEATTMERVAGPQVGNGHLASTTEKVNGSNGHKANGSPPCPTREARPPAQFRRRDGAPVRPVTAEGPMRCLYCDSTLHGHRDCPNAT